jgi:two-component system NtrC family response regulator
VPINCGAIPEQLLESELFGHERGAFTDAHRMREGKLELAEGGTIFLDEIGELPTQLQVKLLRFLQDKVVERVGGREPRRVDARVVAATNKDLQAEIAAGRFREDLYYRLSVVNITVPPLRERGDDLRLLAEFFLAYYAKHHKRRIRGFTQAALRAIQAHAWPGNVRELENRVQRAVILAQDAYVRPQDLELGTEREEGPQSLQEARDEAERRLLTEALTRNAGNITRAARDIKVSRPTLHDLLRKHAMDAGRFRRPDVPGAAEEDEDGPDAAGEDRP